MTNVPVYELGREMLLKCKLRAETIYAKIDTEGMTPEEKEFLRVFCIAIIAKEPIRELP